MYSRKPLDLVTITKSDQINPGIVLKAQRFYLPSEYQLSAKGPTDAIVLSINIGQEYPLAVVASIIDPKTRRPWQYVSHGRYKNEFGLNRREQRQQWRVNHFPKRNNGMPWQLLQELYNASIQVQHMDTHSPIIQQTQSFADMYGQEWTFDQQSCMWSGTMNGKPQQFHLTHVFNMWDHYLDEVDADEEMEKKMQQRAIHSVIKEEILDAVHDVYWRNLVEANPKLIHCSKKDILMPPILVIINEKASCTHGGPSKISLWSSFFSRYCFTFHQDGQFTTEYHSLCFTPLRYVHRQRAGTSEYKSTCVQVCPQCNITVHRDRDAAIAILFRTLNDWCIDSVQHQSKFMDDLHEALKSKRGSNNK